MSDAEQLEQSKRRRMAYALVASYVTAAALAAVAVFVSVSESDQAIADSQRKWCALLVPLDQNYKATPPPTAAGKRFAAVIHDLRIDFGCET